MKLNRKQLRNLILKEVQKMEEDAIVHRFNPGILSKHDDPGREMYTSCSECGGMMYEGECSECGNTMYEEETKKEYGSLNEGGCGCGTCAGCSGSYDSDMDDDFIPDHMQLQGAEDFDILQQTMFDRFPHMKNIDVEFDYEDDDHHEHYSGAYMAKSQLYKVAKYAEKLYQMIPDGHNLEDWMRTKLAQIADDIGEVYHALDHDIYEGDV